MSLSLRIQANEPVPIDVDIRFNSPCDMLGITGPSGAGKSSLLSVLSGTTAIEAQGQWDGNDLRELQAKAGEIHLLYQTPVLFPHLNVRDNLALATDFARNRPSVKSKELAKGEIQPTLHQVAEVCECAHLLEKSVFTLSGGEAQRVALARGILAAPRWLLLDEATSAMDSAMSQRILARLRHYVDAGLFKVVMVSHQLADIALYCDQAVVLSGGKIEHSGHAQALVARYQSQHTVPRFSVLTGTLCDNNQTDAEYGLMQCVVAQQTLYVANPVRVGEKVHVKVNADAVSLDLHTGHESSMLNALQGTIETIALVSEHQVLVTLTVGDQPLYSLISRLSLERMQLTLGQSVTARFKLDHA